MKIAVYEKDTYYLHRVCEIMTEKYGPDTAYIPLDKEGIENALRDGSYSLYIFSDDMEDRAELKGKSVMYWTEEKNVSDKEANRLFKYCNAMEMHKKINQYNELCAMYSIDLAGELHSKILTFFSLGGGMGSSTVAMGAASHFAKMGMKTLYLSLKPFAVTGYFSVNESATDVECLLDDIEEKKGKLNTAVAQISKDSSGVYVLKSYTNILDLVKISEQKIKKILKVLECVGGFEIVVLDMSVSVAEAFAGVCEMSSAISVVLDAGNSDTSVMRWKMGEQYFKALNNSFLDKIKIIYNKYKTMPGVDKDIQDKVVGGIPYVDSARHEDVINKMVNMKFYETLLK